MFRELEHIFVWIYINSAPRLAGPDPLKQPNFWVLDRDPVRFESVIRDCFGIWIHYLAYVCSILDGLLRIRIGRSRFKTQQLGYWI